MVPTLVAVAILPLKASDLVGTWKGLSLCADKRAFPSVHDEDAVCHVTLKDSRTLFVEMNKMVGGKEERMADKPVEMTFDAARSTVTCTIVSRMTSVWTFDVSYSTWAGTAKTADGKVFRRILLGRRS